MEDKIKKALEGIRPALQADGGDVELVSVEYGVVKVHLTGACSSCMMSQVTLTEGIERAIKEAVPQVESVVAV